MNEYQPVAILFFIFLKFAKSLESRNVSLPTGASEHTVGPPKPPPDGRV